MNTQNHIIRQGLATQRTALGHCRLKSCVSTVRCAIILLMAAFAGLASLENAQAFDCGSTGAYGAMNITSSTNLQLPPDGIFNCTTITVASGATLTFSNNSLNTPVYLLATGDVTINGTIDVSALGRLGGPGGFDGGKGGSVIAGFSTGGDGAGPGGGSTAFATFGNAGYDRNGTPISGGNLYGNLLLDPLIGGSGCAGVSGTPGADGRGGGGAVLIASNTRIVVSGLVNSSGATDFYGAHAGSGGAIRLVAPVVSGMGSLSVATPYVNGGTVAGRGRIRIDCTDNTSWRQLSLSSVASRGSRMVVFSATAPVLDIIDVSGQAIPAGTNSSVQIVLPNGTSTNQTVKVQARNFTNDVPIRVIVTPENGPSGSFDATILQSSGNPPSTNVPVIIPVGSACQINAWTR